MAKKVNISKIVFELLKRKTIYGLEPSIDAAEIEAIKKDIILRAGQFDNNYYETDLINFSEISNRILEEDKFNQVRIEDNKIIFNYNWGQKTKDYELCDIPNMIIYFINQYIVEKTKEQKKLSPIPKCFEQSLEGSNITLTDKPSIRERKKELATRISAFLLGELMNRYIEYNISIGRWPAQCTNIHEFIFEKDLGKQINLPGTKEKFVEVYNNCMEVITELMDSNTTFSISNDPFMIGPYGNFLKIINPFPELLIYKYSSSDRTSSTLDITVKKLDVDIKQNHNKDIFAKEYYKFQKELKQKKKK